jgi:hypothetical protein
MEETPITLVALAVLSQLAPVAAGLLARDRLTTARAWVLAWCTMQAGGDFAAILLDATGHDPNWLSYLITPLQGAVVLWALSLWQSRPLARLTLRLAIPLFVVAEAVLAGGIGIRGAGSLASPLYLVLALGAAIYTLGTRGTREADSRFQADWFWMCTGLVVFLGAGASLSPLHPALAGGAMGGGEVVPLAKPLAHIAAALCLTVGALCPLGEARARALSRAW